MNLSRKRVEVPTTRSKLSANEDLLSADSVEKLGNSHGWRLSWDVSDR
jgi:hypothetical protein